MKFENEKQLKNYIKEMILESKLTGLGTTIGRGLKGEFLDNVVDAIPGAGTLKKGFEVGSSLKQGSNQEKLNELLKGTQVVDLVRVCEEFISEFRDPSKSGALISELSSKPQDQIEKHIMTIFNEKCQNAYTDYRLQIQRTSKLHSKEVNEFKEKFEKIKKEMMGT